MSDREQNPVTLERSRYDAFVFDLDGVVTRTAQLHAAAWKELFDAYLATRADASELEPFDVEDDYLEYVDGKPRYEGVKSFLASRGIELSFGSADDPEGYETVCGLGNRKNEIFQDLLGRQEIEIFDGAWELLRRLRAVGLGTAVVSSSKNCARILDAAAIADLFDVRVDGVESAALDLEGKPAPDIFLEAARRLGAAPECCVALEDALSGVEAASRAEFGCVIGVDRAGQRGALEKAGAEVVIEELTQVELAVSIEDLPHAVEAMDRLEERIGGRRLAVFLDYDGTLTPIVSRPEDAELSQAMRQSVRELSAWCPTAVVSGRGLEDVRARVDLPDLVYAGSHGFEIRGPGELAREHEEAAERLPALRKVEQELRRLLADVSGAQVESKGFSLAIHYRNVASGEQAAVEEAVDRALSRHEGLRKTHGKKVFDLQPDVDWNKGRAIGWLLEALDLDRPDVVPLYIGDDLTDEDAFTAIEPEGIGIVVGAGERRTAAHFRLDEPEDVSDLLARLTEVLESEDCWILAYEGFEPEEEGLRESLCTLGNGYFATRGATVESAADGVHYPGTYLAGGYNRLKSTIAGKTIENEDLVNLPNWLSFQFRVPGEGWFALDEVEILAYRQKLDVRRGILERYLRFRDREERETRLLERRLVSIADMHLAALELRLMPMNWSGSLEIRSALDGRIINAGVHRYRELASRHLEPVAGRAIDGRSLLLEMRTTQSKLTIAEAARLEAYAGRRPLSRQWQVGQEAGYVEHGGELEVAPPHGVTLEKTVALYTSRDHAIAECTLEAEKTVGQAGRFQELLREHVLGWGHLWRRFDIDLGLKDRRSGDLDAQRILRLYSFHLLQSASMHSLDIDAGMPSRGWHGEAYRGHIFWDELIIFPFLSYRLPQINRTLLMYRYRRLPEARLAARRLGYKGAMYPWQSGSNGREESQQIHLNPKSGRWIPDNTHLQRHINSAIVYNVWQYYQVTGDLEFLSTYGAEMILEIARLWASIATYDRDADRYEINGVMGPDEYHDAYPGADRPGLRNNAYTNVMAVFVLMKALELFEILHDLECRQLCEKLHISDSERERWEEMTRKMRIVFHDDGIISQFQGYRDLEEFDWEGYREKYGDIQRLDRILEAEGDTPNRYKASKQADVLMLFYLFSADELGEIFARLGYELRYETIPDNIDYYLQRTSNGSSLSWVIHAWVAARLDRAQSWDLFYKALATDAADIQGGTTPEGIHLGAMAGCVDIVQRCYTGLEARGQVLRFNPLFPEQLHHIHLHLRYRGHWLEVDMNRQRLRVESLAGEGEPVWVEAGDQRFELEEGKTWESAL